MRKSPLCSLRLQSPDIRLVRTALGAVAKVLPLSRSEVLRFPRNLFMLTSFCICVFAPCCCPLPLLQIIILGFTEVWRYNKSGGGFEGPYDPL